MCTSNKISGNYEILNVFFRIRINVITSFEKFHQKNSLQLTLSIQIKLKTCPFVDKKHAQLHISAEFGLVACVP